MTDIVILVMPDQESVSNAIASDVLAALRDDFPHVSVVHTLDEVKVHASSAQKVVVFPLTMTAQDEVARNSWKVPSTVCIVGWNKRRAHYDQFDVQNFLSEKGIPTSRDFLVQFDLSQIGSIDNSDSGSRRISVGVIDRSGLLEQLPVVEIPSDPIQNTMYFPSEEYRQAILDRETESVAWEIAITLHRTFGAEFSRTEFVLESSGKLLVMEFIPCPLLANKSLITFAAKLKGYSFEDLCWQLVTNAGSQRFGVVDVHSAAPKPGCELSNFFPHNFFFDEVECASVEGLLQSLKFNDVVRQAEVARLVGSTAKQAGATQNEVWMASQLLWWRGEPIERHSQRYQTFLKAIYESLFAQSASFREALIATGGRVITHRIGLRDASQTVLTERELVQNLMRLRFTLSRSST